MKIIFGMYCLLGSFIFTLDITDIVSRSKLLANKHFTHDAMGNKYDRSKPWYIYNKYIDNNTLEGLLPSNSDPIDTCNMFYLNTKKITSVRMVKTKLLKATNVFNFVELQKPTYNKATKVYTSLMWIRDKSWSGGFCIYVYYKVINHKCKFIDGKPLVVSDIQE